MSIPTQTLLNSMLNALAADTTTFAGGLGVNLVAIPFLSNRDLVWDDVVIGLSTVAGMTSISVAGAAQQRASDPVTADQLIQLIPPVGGFRWECSSAPVEAVLMYGYVVNSATGNGETIYLSERFSLPITINAVGQVIEILAPNLRLTQMDFTA